MSTGPATEDDVAAIVEAISDEVTSVGDMILDAGLIATLGDVELTETDHVLIRIGREVGQAAMAHALYRRGWLIIPPEAITR